MPMIQTKKKLVGINVHKEPFKDHFFYYIENEAIYKGRRERKTFPSLFSFTKGEII